eukprot:TRINITY_DN16716_c0_g1_i1.p2 TRINITY_DN16716_c0_g1~~TRINITY_DN16716_c0_g1_i1.p2  ORF type:complete len:113 (+),score=15.80 TRINITY_DN16716_c0_g1_i1:214-552(+)
MVTQAIHPVKARDVNDNTKCLAIPISATLIALLIAAVVLPLPMVTSNHLGKTNRAVPTGCLARLTSSTFCQVTFPFSSIATLHSKGDVSRHACKQVLQLISTDSSDTATTLK